MCGEEALCLSRRPEPPHGFLSSPRRPVTAFNPVVEAFAGAMTGVRCLMGNRLDAAARFVCDDDPWLAKLRDQPCHEAPGGFGISARLNRNIERITVAWMAPGGDCAPEPMRHAVDRDHNLVEGPLVVRAWTVTADASGKMHPETIDP